MIEGGDAPDVFSAQDPIVALRSDREAAHQAGDANALLCWLATVGGDGTPAVRTLVLREVDGALALFVNATSPKWREMRHHARVQIVCWLPSLQRQWRIDAETRVLPHEVVARHWHRRPRVSQVLDHYYSTHRAQSTPLGDDDADARLEADMNALDGALPEHPDVPTQSLAIALDVNAVDCTQLHPAPRLHQRQRWSRDRADAPWSKTRITP